MDVLDGLVSNTQQRSENKKEYPKEVDQNDKIGKNLEEHFIADSWKTYFPKIGSEKS